MPAVAARTAQVADHQLDRLERARTDRGLARALQPRDQRIQVLGDGPLVLGQPRRRGGHVAVGVHCVVEVPGSIVFGPFVRFRDGGMVAVGLAFDESLAFAAFASVGRALLFTAFVRPAFLRGCGLFAGAGIFLVVRRRGADRDACREMTLNRADRIGQSAELHLLEFLGAGDLVAEGEEAGHEREQVVDRGVVVDLEAVDTQAVEQVGEFLRAGQFRIDRNVLQ